VTPGITPGRPGGAALYSVAYPQFKAPVEPVYGDSTLTSPVVSARHSFMVAAGETKTISGPRACASGDAKVSDLIL